MKIVTNVSNKVDTEGGERGGEGERERKYETKKQRREEVKKKKRKRENEKKRKREKERLTSSAARKSSPAAKSEALVSGPLAHRVVSFNQRNKSTNYQSNVN